MAKHEVGQHVEWTLRGVTRQGKVVYVVEPEEAFQTVMRKLRARGNYFKYGSGERGSPCRPETSYAVFCQDDLGLPKLFWPRASLLVAIKDEE